MGYHLYSTRTRTLHPDKYRSREHAFRDLDTLRKSPACPWDVVVAPNLTRVRRPDGKS